MEQTNINVALLIDSDNISPKYIETVFDELQETGTLTIKRIYGDWTLERAKSWKDILPNYSILPIQQYAYTSGKNSTDSAMIIDAMDILYRNQVDAFCLVSSDSDFTRLAARLRESGKKVIGMGESKTPKAFVSACDSFRYLDVLRADSDTDVDADFNAQETSITPKSEIKQEVLSMLSQKELGNRIQISVVKENLQRKFPDFDQRNYGFSKFSAFLKSLNAFKITLDGDRQTMYISAEHSAQRAEIEAYVLGLLEKSKTKKMNIGEINTKLTDAFPYFSVKALGYKQIKLFLSDIEGAQIQNCDLVLHLAQPKKNVKGKKK